MVPLERMSLFIQTKCHINLILASSHGYLLGNIRGDIKNIYPELALYGRKNECARTDTVFFAISQVWAWGVTLE